MADSIKRVEETDVELPLDKQVPHSGSWEDEVRHKYAVELDLNGQVKVEVLEGKAQEATNGESAEELAVTLELVSNEFTTLDPLLNKLLQEETVLTANAAESMPVDRMAGGDDILGAGKELTETLTVSQ